MDKKILKKSLWLMGLVMAGIGIFDGGTLQAQVIDADCFTGACGGQKGIPQCPDGFDDVGFVLYANSKANAAKDCETVISCANLGDKPVELSCRFYHGFFPIRDGGPTDALCSTSNPSLAPGDTTECATDAMDDPERDVKSAGIFLAGDGNCPTFEGKGLICVKGGNEVFCHAHLACGNGTVLESISIERGELSRPTEAAKLNKLLDLSSRIALASNILTRQDIADIEELVSKE